MTLVDLSDPVVSTLEVQVTADAPWDGDPGVSRVIITVEYRGPQRSQGHPTLRSQAHTHTHTHTHTPSDCAEGVPLPACEARFGNVKYSAVASNQGTSEPVKIPMRTTNGHVHVQVAEMGAFKLKLRPHPNMFTATQGAGKSTGVQVNYEYKDAGAPDQWPNRHDPASQSRCGRAGRDPDVPGNRSPVRFENLYTFVRAHQPSRARAARARASGCRQAANRSSRSAAMDRFPPDGARAAGGRIETRPDRSGACRRQVPEPVDDFAGQGVGGRSRPGVVRASVAATRSTRPTSGSDIATASKAPGN